MLKVKGQILEEMKQHPCYLFLLKYDKYFTKKWWFRVLVLLLTTGIMYSFFRYRFEQALALEILRTKISSYLHDDVGSYFLVLPCTLNLWKLMLAKPINLSLKKLQALVEILFHKCEI